MSQPQDKPDRTLPKNGSRPQSYYDNFSEQVVKPVRPKSDGNAYTIRDSKVESPTQTHCLMTTVPQNIAAQKIGGKHTPTRNSLRHSRMIVLNRCGRIPTKYLPAIIRYHKLAKCLMGLVTLFGVALCFMSVWFLIWTPNLRSRDNTYWSAIPVLVSGIFGLILLCCCRKQYPGAKRSYIVQAIKIISISISTVAATAALISCSFSIIHLVTLSSMDCSPFDNMNKTCVCTVTKLNNSDTVPAIKSYHYVDLTCPEVENVLTILLIFSAATNILAAILLLWYLYLHWLSRLNYDYSAVRTEEQKMTPVKTNS